MNKEKKKDSLIIIALVLLLFIINYSYLDSALTNFLEDSGKTGIDLNTVNGAALTNIEVINTVGGFGLMILDSNKVTVNNITTSGNSWGGVSVHAININTENVKFEESFNVSEDVPLLLEKDPPYAGDFVNVDTPDEFGYVVYGERESSGYKQWFYQETLPDAKTFADGLVTSESYNYIDVIIYDIAEENYYVEEGMLIQDAINSASDGDTIEVYNGTYNETLMVDKDNLTIKAAEGENPVIQTADSGWIVGIRGENVTFENFELIGNGANYGIQTQTHTKNATLNNNIISNVITAIQTTAGVEIGENTISNNKISNAQVGISLQNSNNTVMNNEINAVIEGLGIGSTKWPVTDNRVAYNMLIVKSGGIAAKVYNSSHGFGHVDGSELNAENNWWGTTNRTLIQGNVSGNVDFTPWAYTSSLDTDSEAPVIDLSDASVDEGSSVVLDASGSTDNAAGIVSYEWDLDNDSVYELSGKSMDGATFDAPSINGTTSKTVNFRVTDMAGNTANKSMTVTVNNVVPIVSASSNISAATLDEVIQFNATASDPVDSLSYSWDFGDGNVTSGQNLTHKYNSSGTYTVTLTVSDGEDTNSTTLNIKVNDLIWDLNSEWNLVSSPKTTAQDMSSLGTRWGYDNGWIENPTTIEAGKGYWVDNSSETELGLDYEADCGFPRCLPNGKINIVALNEGWNLIGLTTTEPRQVKDAFGSSIYNDTHLPVYEVVSYNGTFNLMNPTENMVPGKGYWVLIK